MWPNPLEITDLVTFTEEILHGKLHFLFGDVNFNKNVLHQRGLRQNLKKVILVNIILLKLSKSNFLTDLQIIHGIELAL